MADIVEVQAATSRLAGIAMKDTGQSYRVANFLLGWANARRFGGFDLANADMLDEYIRADILVILHYLLRVQFIYPLDIGFGPEFEKIAARHGKIDSPRIKLDFSER